MTFVVYACQIRCAFVVSDAFDSFRFAFQFSDVVDDETFAHAYGFVISYFAFFISVASDTVSDAGIYATSRRAAGLVIGTVFVGVAQYAR